MVYGILSRNSNNAKKRGKVKCTNTKKCGSRQLESKIQKGVTKTIRDFGIE